MSIISANITTETIKNGINTKDLEKYFKALTSNIVSAGVHQEQACPVLPRYRRERQSGESPFSRKIERILRQRKDTPLPRFHKPLMRR